MSAPILYRFKQNPIVNGWLYYYPIELSLSKSESGEIGDVFIKLAENKSMIIILSKYGVRRVYKSVIEALK